MLAVLLRGELAGHVFKAADRRLVFSYEPAWREHADAFPLSLSMPLVRAEHGHRATSAFLWGLLPDDPRVIESWARQFDVGRTDVTGLLAHVGEDCAGAVQIVTPARMHEALGAPSGVDQTTSIEWLSPRAVGKLLAALRQHPDAGRSSRAQGRFSLAGAQPKTALYYADGKWGIPRGRVPSTHILKPPVLDLANIAFNEHACLALAGELGLPAARSRVQTFGGEIAIVVERYDRVHANGVVTRVHQEDMCQAMARQPTDKYETDGGPTIVDIATVLHRHSSESLVDVARFIEACAFNWLIAAPDAHAKNYAVLHAAGPVVRLAPLYDVISAAPYPRQWSNGVSLAMGVGGERRVDAITGSHWRTLARQVGLPPDALVDRIVELAERVPAAIDRVVADHVSDAAARDIVAELMLPVRKHVARCAKRV